MENSVNNDVNCDVNKNKTNNIVFFILTSIFFLLFEVIWVAVGIDYNNLSPKTKILLMFVKYFVFIIIYIIRYRKYLIIKLKDFKNNFRKYLGISFKYWGIGFLLMMIINTILGKIISGSGANEETVQLYLKSSPVLMFIATTFFAPFVEELMYRKSLQDCFKNKTLFIIISGLIFGLVHVLGANTPLELLFILSYGAFGSCFAITLTKTDNVYATIMLHMFHNGVLSLISILLAVLR